MREEEERRINGGGQWVNKGEKERERTAKVGCARHKSLYITLDQPKYLIDNPSDAK